MVKKSSRDKIHSAYEGPSKSIDVIAFWGALWCCETWFLFISFHVTSFSLIFLYAFLSFSYVFRPVSFMSCHVPFVSFHSLSFCFQFLYVWSCPICFWFRWPPNSFFKFASKIVIFLLRRRDPSGSESSSSLVQRREDLGHGLSWATFCQFLIIALLSPWSSLLMPLGDGTFLAGFHFFFTFLPFSSVFLSFPFIFFRFPFFSFHFLRFSFHFLPFSFHFPFVSFHVSFIFLSFPSISESSIFLPFSLHVPLVSFNFFSFSRRFL